MIRPFLAPRWLALHAALLVALVACVVFAQWQLSAFGRVDGERQQQKRVPLDALARPGAPMPDSAVGREVTVRGRYDASRQLLVPRPLDGRAGGFLVVTPMRTESGVVAISRGWVARPRDAMRGLPTARTTVYGVVQRSESEQDSHVDLLDPLPVGQIPYLSSVQFIDAWPYSSRDLYDGYVQLTGQRPARTAAPELVQPRVDDADVGAWRNLAYGLQWWLFAAAAVFFWSYLVRRAAQEQRSR